LLNSLDDMTVGKIEADSTRCSELPPFPTVPDALTRYPNPPSWTPFAIKIPQPAPPIDVKTKALTSPRFAQPMKALSADRYDELAARTKTLRR
jgi:hypothetical protein